MAKQTQAQRQQNSAGGDGIKNTKRAKKIDGEERGDSMSLLKEK